MVWGFAFVTSLVRSQQEAPLAQTEQRVRRGLFGVGYLIIFFRYMPKCKLKRVYSMPYCTVCRTTYTLVRTDVTVGAIREVSKMKLIYCHSHSSIRFYESNFQDSVLYVVGLYNVHWHGIWIVQRGVAKFSPPDLHLSYVHLWPKMGGSRPTRTHQSSTPWRQIWFNVTF